MSKVERNQAIFDACTDAIMLLNEEGFVDCNVATLKMFECNSAAEFLGKHPSEYSPPNQPDGTDSWQAANEKITTAYKTGSNLFEWQHQRTNGELFFAEVQLTLLKLDDGDMLHATVRDITARKASEETLKRTLSHLKGVIEHARDAFVCMDRAGIIIDWNPEAQRLFGFSHKKAVGRKLSETIIPSEYKKRHVSGLKSYLQTGVQKVINKHIEITALHKNGDIIPVELSIVPVGEGEYITFNAFIRDLSASKNATNAILNSERKIRMLLDSTAEAIYGIDTSGNCTLINKSCVKMLGYDKESELLGKNMHQLIHHSYADGTFYPAEQCKIYQAFREGEGSHVDDEVLWRKDGSSFPVSYWSYPIFDDATGEVNGSVVTFLDISEQVKSKHQLKKSQEKLQNALEGTIVAVTKAVEARDPYTAGHQRRVADLSMAIAKELGFGDEKIKGIYLGAIIHDIGKIQMPAEILTKPAKLTDIEYQLIQGHPEAGYQILKDVQFAWPVADVAYQHHEKMDGSGYPRGLRGEGICIEARIVAVADVVEAMSSHRPYRPGLGIDTALQEVQDHRGIHYDEKVVDACVRLFEENRFSF